MDEQEDADDPDGPRDRGRDRASNHAATRSSRAVARSPATVRTPQRTSTGRVMTTTYPASSPTAPAVGSWSAVIVPIAAR